MFSFIIIQQLILNIIFMLLSSLIFTPIIGIFIISSMLTYNVENKPNLLKSVALFVTIVNLAISLIIFILFDFSSKQYQFVQEQYEIGQYDIYLGIDGISIYFVLLTTIIIPISIVSN
jgi:NADH-ubiquinone oxidoreductase chain 4